MDGVGDAHGTRPRRKEDMAGWLLRVLCKLECDDHGPLAYARAVTLLEKHEWPNAGWNCQMVWMGG